MLACALSAAPAQAQKVTRSERPLVSSNITPLATIPGIHPVGARIRDNFMYVTGVDGLTVFDISDPALPLPVGALPLPHFENEDVDLGGDTLLISNDPSEGVGIVFVIDISDPTMPVLRGASSNGFIDFCQSCFGPQAEAALPPGTGHTISCIPGPESACQYAWAAGTGHGIAIFDLTDPSAPAFVKEWKPEITGWTTHDVQVDGEGLAWVVGADGTAAYDITDPVNPRMVMRTDPAVKNGGVTLPGFLPPSANPDEDKVVPLPEPFQDITVGGKGDQPIDFIHHDSLRFGGQDRAATPAPEPPPVATGGEPQAPPAGAPPQDPPPSSPPGQDVAGERRGSQPQSQPRTACSRGNRAARARCIARLRRECRRGTAAARKRCRARLRAALRAQRVSARRASATASPRARAAAAPREITYPRGGTSDVVGIVEEDYNRPTCEGAGSFQTWRIRGDTLFMEDMWATEVQSLTTQSGFAPLAGLCSAHYFDEREGLTANAWYEEGTRFLDVSDPANIRQVGYWIPTKGETWSALFAPNDPDGEIVYALDFVRGIDVLRIDRAATAKTRKAPIRRSWVRRTRAANGSKLTVARTGYSKRGRFGFVCRRPTAKALRRWR